MKYSKAFALLRGISKEQLKSLLGAVKNHKRPGLKKLFLTLTEALPEGEPESAEVFKIVFGKKYGKKEDYLLRNEYRLLYAWMLEELCQEGGQDKTDDISVIKFLLVSRIYDLFEEEFNAAWRKNTEKENVTVLLLLSDLNIEYHLSGKAQTLQNAITTADLCKQRIELLKTDFLRKVRTDEVRLKMAERVTSAYKDNMPSAFLLTVNLEELEASDSFAQYLRTRAQINFARGEEKIKLIKTILSRKEILHKYENNPEEATCRFLINLAQEHYFTSNFSDAVAFYKKAFGFYDKVSLPVKEVLVINYVLALMRNQRYSEAAHLAMTNDSLLLKSKILGSRSPFLLAALNLYERNPEGAEKFVDLESKNEGSEFYFHMRLVLSAVYYLRGNLDLAIRESINVDQAVNYELNHEPTLQTKVSKPIVSLFRRFYLTWQQIPGNDRSKSFEKLKNEVQQSINAFSDQSPNSILTEWLVQEINGMLNPGKKNKPLP